MLLLFLLPNSVLAVVNPSPSPTPSSSSLSVLLPPTNHSSSVEMNAAMMQQQEKKVEPDWSPSLPDLTQMQQQQYSYTPPPPFMPANYYLPGNNHYGPAAPSTEFRASEHYVYPFEPQSYAYPVSAPSIDSALIPTAKHFVIVSFIGLLLLFAVIQNSIAAAKRKDALVEVLSNRRKRELVALDDMTPELVSALKEDARVRCIQRTLCYENRKLLEDLGFVGKVLGKYLTRGVQSSLKELSPGWDRLVEDAANAGLRGEDCDVVYRDCNFVETPDEAAIDDEEE
ncbi:uncharacterized protein LOC116416141 [Nasonia vitripennis]|uniref:Uncharacterized protein n=1 Tax=Nasonia vitripennis TaxID=7425 RepID=A0A7M7PZK9_NASVI|nr:uncharacterized protein LOC116416141 [Nasonia vitripennis]